uniref:HAT C-terminal dimerisation domain-containing protein n=1 Tax=Romanomermis culicivorax TaxID=13658 RepID=A0A915HTK0_ROMCU
MLILDDLPFSHVEDMGFMRVMKQLSANSSTLADVLITGCWLQKTFEKDSEQERGIGTMMDTIGSGIETRFVDMERNISKRKTSASSSSTTIAVKRSLAEFLAEESEGDEDTSSQLNQLGKELDQYSRLKKLKDGQQNVLAWWKENQKDFPILAAAA